MEMAVRGKASFILLRGKKAASFPDVRECLDVFNKEKGKSRNNLTKENTFNSELSSV
ncbi:hypothetical protein HNQ56_004556 [Anaerotaenia torta]|uniref:hypothetical protein n=1 Tax=Anaerotaenia torta TaxID=433293 RepID=UPI003D1AB0A0